MNFHDSVEYLRSVEKIPGQHDHPSVVLHEYVSDAGDVWVIGETMARDPWASVSGPREMVKAFIGACVLEGVPTDHWRPNGPLPHDTATTWYARTLAEAQGLANACDVASVRASAIEDNTPLPEEADYEMQTWEWDEKLGRDVPVYHPRLFKVTPTRGEIYGGDQ